MADKQHVEEKEKQNRQDQDEQINTNESKKDEHISKDGKDSKGSGPAKTDSKSSEIEKDKESEKKEKEEEKDIRAEGIEKLNAELEEAKDKYLRLYSEYENYRRRTSREKLDMISHANEELIADLLPVLDDFERAGEAHHEKQKGKEDKEVKELKEGIELIANKFKKVLEKKGLKEMESPQGTEFDAELHEAISQIPAPSKKLKGKIVDTIEKGYYLGDKVIRFAKVVIGS